MKPQSFIHALIGSFLLNILFFVGLFVFKVAPAYELSLETFFVSFIVTYIAATIGILIFSYGVKLPGLFSIGLGSFLGLTIYLFAGVGAALNVLFIVYLFVAAMVAASLGVGGSMVFLKM